jgi:hypothetical protein
MIFLRGKLMIRKQFHLIRSAQIRPEKSILLGILSARWDGRENRGNREGLGYDSHPHRRRTTRRQFDPTQSGIDFDPLAAAV